MTEMQRVALKGCTPEPMLGYLKALGLFRLVAEQADAQARSAWVDGCLCLETRLDEQGLVRFLLQMYQPTPILAPWNGGSGFWDSKAAGQALKAVAESTSPRLELYRQTIARIRRVIGELGVTKSDLQSAKTKESVKSHFVRRLRSALPEESLAWMDALAVITGDELRFVPAPILGTGANDGNLDFTKNFMERLPSVLPFHPEPEAPAPAGSKRPKKGAYDPAWSQACLEDALFGTGGAALAPAALGQYHPGGAGGANAGQGFGGASLVNPWDYILLIEGSLVLAGAAARRLGTESGSRASFPFTVEMSPVGCGTLAEAEKKSARAEVWLPLWGQPSSFAEVRHLFAEGRAQVGGRQARSGLDFARAVAGLGVDRGLSAFQRYAFVQRNGLAYLAAPLGRLPVGNQPAVHLIDELDPWLYQLQRVAAPPGALRAAIREVDQRIYAYCEHGGSERLLRVVAAVGAAERAVARNPANREQVSPLQHMSLRWLSACNDGSAAFRLAAAIASIRDPAVGRIRQQLEPVQGKNGRWDWNRGSGGQVWGEGGLSRNLLAVLQRRLLEGTKQGRRELPIGADRLVSLADVWCYLTGQVDAELVSDLIWGFATLRWSDAGRLQAPTSKPAPELDRSYALLKLLFLPDGIRLMAGDEPVVVKPEPAILARLRAGRLEDAVQIAYRRLWASGFVPLGLAGKLRRTPPRFHAVELDLERLASALLLPVFETERLARMVLRFPEEERQAPIERKGS